VPGTKDLNDHVIIGLDHQTIAGLQGAKLGDHNDQCPRRRAAVCGKAAGDFLAFAFENNRETGLIMRTANHQAPLPLRRTICSWRPVCAFVMPQERAQRPRGSHEVGPLLRDSGASAAAAALTRLFGLRRRDWIGALADWKSRRGIVVVHSRGCAVARPGRRVAALGSKMGARHVVN
jgi:hypothetical protein